jgi:hypothetical protein
VSCERAIGDGRFSSRTATFLRAGSPRLLLPRNSRKAFRRKHSWCSRTICRLRRHHDRLMGQQQSSSLPVAKACWRPRAMNSEKIGVTLLTCQQRTVSSVGRASPLHGGCRGFESLTVHSVVVIVTTTPHYRFLAPTDLLSIANATRSNATSPLFDHAESCEHTLSAESMATIAVPIPSVNAACPK